jgi:hypothetical protein
MTRIGFQRILTVGLVLSLLAVFSTAGAVNLISGADLTLNKTSFAPGEQIVVTFKAPAGWARDAWIGIIPSNIAHGSETVNDQHDITYQYLEGRTGGTMFFKAPAAGQWDMRMHDTDGGGKETAYVSFKVSGTAALIGTDQLWLDKANFATDEPIQVHFQAPANWPENAWIGIIPSNIAHGSETTNDQNDVDYQYIKKRTSGIMTFKSPGTGKWDMRMHDTDNGGKEIAYVSFTVGQVVISGTGKIWLNKTVFAPGESIQVKFEAPAGWSRDAWVGIIPSNTAHGSETVNDQYDITYQYIEGRTSGVMYFKAPGPGQWDIRMHDTDAGGREIASLSFTVR